MYLLYLGPVSHPWAPSQHLMKGWTSGVLNTKIVYSLKKTWETFRDKIKSILFWTSHSDNIVKALLNISVQHFSHLKKEETILFISLSFLSLSSLPW